jgi:hypothetical protein
MHKQRNWEKGLEGRRNSRKHREASGEAELQSMTALRFDKAWSGVALTQH